MVLSEFILISLPSFGEVLIIKVIVLFPALVTSLVTAFRSCREIGFLEPKKCQLQGTQICNSNFSKRVKFCMHKSPSHLGILLSILISFYTISRFALFLVTF